MSHLIVVTFDNPDEAGQVRTALKQIEKQSGVSLDDTAVIVKDADGKVNVNDEIDRGIKVGALGGSILGVLLTFWFPIVGLVAGAAGGALVGKMMDMGIAKAFIQDVTESLQPNTSALFALIGGANPDLTIAAIEPFRGTLYHTSLPTNLEESLRDALR